MSGKDKTKNLRINKRSIDTDGIITILGKDLPTLISDEKFNILTDGDEDPYIVAQAIKYPIFANGDNYTEEFFESFLERNKDSYFPGSKGGHSWSSIERQDTHFYQVGGQIVKNNNGTGTVYFKLYIPKNTDFGSNESFIKEVKADGVDFSLVSNVGGRWNDTTNEYDILSSKGYERNDAVGRGEGSMNQKINSKKEVSDMTPEELLKKLNIAIENKEISKKDVLTKLNCSDLIKTEEDEKNLKIHTSLVDVLGESPIEKATELTKAVKLNADAAREKVLFDAFGKSDKDNLVRNMAETLLVGKELNETEIESVKTNSLFLAISGDEADHNSVKNKLKVSEGNETGVAGVVM